MCGKDTDMFIRDSETMSSIRNLMNVLLGRDINSCVIFIAIPISDLESKCRLSNSWFSGEKDKTSWCEPITKDGIELATSKLNFRDRFTRWKNLKNFLPFSTGLFLSFRRKYHFFLKGAPLATSRTFSLPFLSSSSTFTTSIHKNKFVQG